MRSQRASSLCEAVCPVMYVPVCVVRGFASTRRSTEIPFKHTERGGLVRIDRGSVCGFPLALALFVDRVVLIICRS